MDKRLKIPLVVSIIAAVSSLLLIILFYTNNKNECIESGMIFENGQCRTKTIQEQFEEKCEKDSGTTGLIVHGVAIGHTCSEIKAAGLMEPYVHNKISEHDNKLYVTGTDVEISAGKESGDYCLEASDTWSHVGQKRCVVLSYETIACQNGYCFLNEKKDYKEGFVVFFGKYNMYSWNSFKEKFINAHNIAVCGNIVMYQGHPEIKITNESQFKLNPNGTVLVDDLSTRTVYKFNCK